jgi:hypothetical protein
MRTFIILTEHKIVLELNAVRPGYIPAQSRARVVQTLLAFSGTDTLFTTALHFILS